MGRAKGFGYKDNKQYKRTWCVRCSYIIKGKPVKTIYGLLCKECSQLVEL